jgi:hypothetical protein
MTSLVEADPSIFGTVEAGTSIFNVNLLKFDPGSTATYILLAILEPLNISSKTPKTLIWRECDLEIVT